MERAAAAFIGLLTLGVHALRLVHAGSLWRDEAGALGLATLPSVRAVLAQFPHEAFPPAVPLAIRLYTRVAGESDQALRWLGMAIGLAIAGALWLSANLTGRNLPLLSLALIAGSAWFVVFGDSIRGYGLGSLSILLAFAAMARLLVRPGAWSATAALLAVLCAVHCVLGNSALVAALCAAALITALRYGNRFAALAVPGIGVAAMLSLLPYVAPLTAAGAWNAVAVDSIGLGKVLAGLGTTLNPAGGIWLVLAGLALAGPVRRAARPGGGAGGPAPAPAAISHPAMAAAPGGGAHRAAAPHESRGDDVRLFSGLVIVLGVAAQLLFLEVLSYTPRVWYYLPLVALVAAALEPLVADLFRAPRARLARIGLAVLLAAALALFHLPQLRARMTNVDLIARRLASSAATGDLVLVSPWYMGVSFNRYYRGPATWVTVPDVSDHRFHRYDLFKMELARAHPLAEAMNRARRALAGGYRVWVVGQLQVPPRGQAPPLLAPAPGTAFGWKDTPYLQSWALQLGAFLRDHAASLQTLAVPSPDPVSPYEDLSLAVASGWR